MIITSRSLNPGSQVRYRPEYLQETYGEAIRRSPLWLDHGIITSIKQGLASGPIAIVAWNSGVTYQVPIEYLEDVYADKKKVPA
jgi:hypothetical protein